MVDIDELERLLAAATDGPWRQPWGVNDPTICAADNAFLIYDEGGHTGADAALIVALHNSAPAMIAEIRELRAENARLRMANRSLRRGLYGLTDSGDADEIATTLEAGGVVDWDKYPPNARAALGEPQ